MDKTAASSLSPALTEVREASQRLEGTR